MSKEIITSDLAGDLEALFEQTDLYYGQDGNLYSESQEDYASPLAYVTPEEKDEDGVVLTWKCVINN